MKTVADDRGIATMWQGSLLLRTFRNCGIDPAAYESAIDTYPAEAYLPDAVEAELRDAEKPDSPE